MELPLFQSTPSRSPRSCLHADSPSTRREGEAGKPLSSMRAVVVGNYPTPSFHSSKSHYCLQEGRRALGLGGLVTWTAPPRRSQMLWLSVAWPWCCRHGIDGRRGRKAQLSIGTRAEQEMLTLGKGDKQKVGGKALLKPPKQRPQKPQGPHWSSRSRRVEVTAEGTQRARSAGEGFVLKAKEAEFPLLRCSHFPGQAWVQATRPFAPSLWIGWLLQGQETAESVHHCSRALAAVWASQPELSSRKQPWFPVNSPQLPLGLNYSLGSPHPSATRLSPACGMRNTQRRVPSSWLLVAAPFRVETGRADTELAGGRASQRRASSFPHTWGAARPRG